MRAASPRPIVKAAAAAAPLPPAPTFASDAGAVVAAMCWLASLVFCALETARFSSSAPPAPLPHHTSGPPPWRPDTSAAPAAIGGMTVAFAALHVTLKLAFKSPSTTYYLEHTIVNAVIVALVWPDTLSTIFYPLSCMRAPYTILPTYAQIAFHIAHMLCEFRTLTPVDWGHHLLSSAGNGFLNVHYTYGPLLNFALFFATGLPGGIDYFLMYLVKRQILSSFTEKRINRFLNIVLRCPGLIMWMSFGHVVYASGLAARHWRTASATVEQGQMEMPLAALLFMYVFVAGNGIYFMDRVVGSYYRQLQAPHKGG